jgi:hypothetical protein
MKKKIKLWPDIRKEKNKKLIDKTVTKERNDLFANFKLVNFLICIIAINMY